MNYLYLLVLAIMLLLPKGIMGYHVVYDSFPSVSGIAGTNDYLLDAVVTDVEGGSMTDGTYQIISSSMLIEIAQATEIQDVENPIITSFLYQNHPNPFNPSTMIPFNLRSASEVNISVYNLKGQLVKKLVDSKFIPGHHELQWDGKDERGMACSSGVYIVRMVENNRIKLRRAVLIK